MSPNEVKISPDMKVIDIVSKKNETIDVFNRYEDQAGECICCNSLFETLDKVSEKYHIDLEAILNDLNNV